MEVSQVYQFVNDAAQESIGESAVLAEDLSNVVDMGTAIFNGEAFDKFVRSLVNHIGKVIRIKKNLRLFHIPSKLKESCLI